MFSNRASYPCFYVSIVWFNSGEEETANLLLGKFKWGHAFLSLNRCVFVLIFTYLFSVNYEDTLLIGKYCPCTLVVCVYFPEQYKSYVS